MSEPVCSNCDRWADCFEHELSGQVFCYPCAEELGLLAQGADAKRLSFEQRHKANAELSDREYEGYCDGMESLRDPD